MTSYLSSAQETIPSETSPWLLTKVEGEKLKLPTGSKFFIVFIHEEQKFSGYTSCNSFNGKLSITKDSMRLEEFILTERFCSNEVSELEQKVMTFLSAVNTWKEEDNTLFMYDSKGLLVLEFKSSTK